MNFSLTAKAKEDLKEIARYTQGKWGREQRNAYLGMLDDSFRRLADNAALGRRCGEVKPGYLKFPSGSHMIYYRTDPIHSILIVRVLHRRMDFDLQL